MNLPSTSRTREELNNNAKFEELLSNVRNITREMDKPVHRKLTIHGYISNNYKRTSLKGSKNIASINTLEKSPDGRKFLRKLGHQQAEGETVTIDRDLQTVSPEQSLAI